MFDISFWELFLVFIVILLVIGPARLPQLARTIGYWLQKGKHLISTVKSEFDHQIKYDELQNNIKRAETAEKEGQNTSHNKDEKNKE